MPPAPSLPNPTPVGVSTRVGHGQRRNPRATPPIPGPRPGKPALDSRKRPVSLSSPWSSLETRQVSQNGPSSSPAWRQAGGGRGPVMSQTASRPAVRWSGTRRRRRAEAQARTSRLQWLREADFRSLATASATSYSPAPLPDTAPATRPRTRPSLQSCGDPLERPWMKRQSRGGQDGICPLQCPLPVPPQPALWVGASSLGTRNPSFSYLPAPCLEASHPGKLQLTPIEVPVVAASPPSDQGGSTETASGQRQEDLTLRDTAKGSVLPRPRCSTPRPPAPPRGSPKKSQV